MKRRGPDLTNLGKAVIPFGEEPEPTGRKWSVLEEDHDGTTVERPGGLYRTFGDGCYRRIPLQQD